jgi:hypothetical protein
MAPEFSVFRVLSGLFMSELLIRCDDASTVPAAASGLVRHRSGLVQTRMCEKLIALSASSWHW